MMRGSARHVPGRASRAISNRIQNPVAKNDATLFSATVTRVTSDLPFGFTTGLERSALPAGGNMSFDAVGPSGANRLAVTPGERVFFTYRLRLVSSDAPTPLGYARAYIYYYPTTNGGTSNANFVGPPLYGCVVGGDYIVSTGVNEVPTGVAGAICRCYFGLTSGYNYVMHVSGLMLCDAAAEVDYFDGDSPGCSWTGTAHTSPSTKPASYGAPA